MRSFEIYSLSILSAFIVFVLLGATGAPAFAEGLRENSAIEDMVFSIQDLAADLSGASANVNTLAELRDRYHSLSNRSNYLMLLAQQRGESNSERNLIILSECIQALAILDARYAITNNPSTTLIATKAIQ